MTSNTQTATQSIFQSLTFAHIITFLTTLSGLFLMLFTPEFLPPQQVKVIGLALMIIGLWATAQLPEHLTALLFFLLAILVIQASPANVFSGFASSAFWMGFGGIVIALATNKSGLSQRLVHHLSDKVSGTYPSLVFGCIVMGLLLSFIMPSSVARVAMLVPVTLVMAEAFGFQAGSNGRIGLILAASFGTFFPSFAILPNNVPNMVLMGSSETLFGIVPLYGEYLLLHFPVLSLIKQLIIGGFILWLFPDQPQPYSGKHDAPSSLTPQEKKMSWVLFIGLTLWLTDFMHHISPAWIALAMAIFLMLPRIGLIQPKEFEQIKFAPLIFIAGILGLGAVIAESNLGNLLANALTEFLPLEPEHDLVNFVSLTLISMITGIFTTQPGVPAVLTPLAEHFAQQADWPLKSVLMTQVLGFSTPIFIYQVPPLVIAMQLAGEKMMPAIKLTLWLALACVLLLLPLDYLWWQLLGWI